MQIVIADNVFIFVSTALVLMMSVPALALFYGGLTKVKSVLNTIMMVFTGFIIAAFLWIVYGYSLAFGPDHGGVIGKLQYLFLMDIDPKESAPAAPNLYHYLFIFFQLTFAGIATALMAGAFVERMKFSAWMIISVLWATLIYFPVVHWIWGGGFLSEFGTLDFAGGIVLHETSGLSALLGAMILGRRKDAMMLPSSLPLVAIGTGLLWFGWFGFNGGSALGMNHQAVSAAFVTSVAAMVGGFVWMVLEWIEFKKPTSLGLFTGIIAGLATITPASGYVNIWGGFVIGFLASLVCFWAVVSVKKRFRYDDSLDVFGVHGVGGILGAILLAFFANPDVAEVQGLFYGGGLSQLWPQLVAIGIVGIYTLLLTYVIFKITDKLVGLRVTKDEEIEGLDEALHGEKAYSKEY